MASNPIQPGTIPVVTAQLQGELIPKKRPWVVKFCDCLDYKDKRGNKLCVPHFCPVSLFLTGIIAGQTCSKIHNETPICCDLGCLGCLVCLISTPISFESMLGGMACFFCLSAYQRESVIRLYDVEEEKTCCCGPCNPCAEFLHFHCNYPCSFFQVYVSILEWEEEKKNALAAKKNDQHVPIPIVVAVPAPHS